MSDSKKIPSLPPDDFSKTTPNIPRADDFDSADWEKTNYNAGSGFPAQPSADDWGKTMANIPPIKEESDFNKTFMPSNNPKTPDWGVTDQNIKLPNDDFGGGKEDFGNRTNYGATAPFIHLPEETRAKYQTPPPTPTQKAEQEKQEEKKGGIPGWFWATAGLLTMFFVMLIGIFAVYFFFLRPSGFDVVIQGAPPRSRILVDGVEWSVTEGDGNLIARGLKANEKKRIEIKHPNFTCDPREIEGSNGKTETINARCTPINVPPPEDCTNIKKGEFDKAERCANQALDKLVPPYNPDDIAKALNLYIINFASGKYDIPPKNKEFLKKAATYLKQLPPTTQIEVGGHTDNVGTDANNMTLSNNRAKAVRDALVNEFGVPAAMLTEKGYGESKPKATNDTEDGKFQNRRIEYIVLKK